MRAPLSLHFHNPTNTDLLTLPLSHFSSTSAFVDDWQVITTAPPARLSLIPNPIYYCLETPPIPLSPISIHPCEQRIHPYALMSVDIPDKASIGLLNSADIELDQ